MTSRTGSLSVNTNDIFPIIKKWLYSEHDIFLRELVSNSSDAITKRSTLGRTQNVEVPAGGIQVVVDKENKVIKIQDNGIGMTEAEIEKYIAQLAFSGAEEFVKKLKDQGIEAGSAKDEIIGKFGLGFYSAFMVANKVVVDSLSMTTGSKPARWTCEGSTDYVFTEGDRAEVGTTITLFINDDSAEFLDFWKTRSTLARYCDFMPYPIEIIDASKKAEEGEEKDIINTTTPLWKRDPAEIKDEEYKAFYQKMFPMDPEPLFWLHLNVEHPFEIKGILYFPKLNPSKPFTENNIRLYCRQVFVSDNVKSVIPEFLSLLKGAIDSVDIPLNVSRSALQGDPNVKKISNYIVKKVAESLKKLFNNDRTRYEQIWEDIGLFVKYGVISDNKFDEMMRSMVLFKNSEGKLITLEDYRNSIPATLTEKLKDTVLYFEKNKGDAALKQQLLAAGVQTIETEDYIDPHFMQHAEMNKQGEHSVKFASLDSEAENVLESDNATDDDIKVKELFTEILVPKDSKTIDVEVKNLKGATAPAYFKVDEQSKRFQQMTKAMGQTSFALPLKKTLVINPSNPLVKNAFKLSQKTERKELAAKLCHHVQDLATISSEGLTTETKEQFVKRSQDLLQELSQIALN